jgi:hypothetical protein
MGREKGDAGRDMFREFEELGRVMNNGRDYLTTSQDSIIRA